MQPRIDPNTLPIGLPWCREENYDAFRAMLEDGLVGGGERKP